MNRAEASMLLGAADSFTENMIRRKAMDQAQQDKVLERAMRERLANQQQSNWSAEQAATAKYRGEQTALQKDEAARRGKHEDRMYAEQQGQTEVAKMAKDNAELRGQREQLQKQAEQLNKWYSDNLQGIKDGTINPEAFKKQLQEIRGQFMEADAYIRQTSPWLFTSEDVPVQAPPAKPEKPVFAGKRTQRVLNKDGDVVDQFEEDLTADQVGDLKKQAALEKIDTEISRLERGTAVNSNFSKNRLDLLRAERAKLTGGQAPAAAPAPAPAAAAKPSGRMVRVKAPNGQVGSIPVENLAKAKQQGYVEL